MTVRRIVVLRQGIKGKELRTVLSSSPGKDLLRRESAYKTIKLKREIRKKTRWKTTAKCCRIVQEECGVFGRKPAHVASEYTMYYGRKSVCTDQCPAKGEK
jgi:hypothetical protein